MAIERPWGCGGRRSAGTLDAAVYPIQCCIVTASPEVQRPKRRRTETVERLLDAALETFAEIGFAAASVEDICRRGGFTRGAFYSSFRSKDELFAALFERETARNLARAEEQLGGHRDRGRPGHRRGRALPVRLPRGPHLGPGAHRVRLHAARHPEAAAALRRHAEGLHRRLTALIETAAARIGLRLTLPAHRLARIVLALHDGVVIREVLGGGAASGSAGDRAASDLERTALLLCCVPPPPTDPGDPFP